MDLVHMEDDARRLLRCPLRAFGRMSGRCVRLSCRWWLSVRLRSLRVWAAEGGFFENL